MADYTKTYTIDFTQHGDSVFTGIDKTEDNIDSLVTWVNDLKDNYASATAPTSPAPSEGQLWWDSTNDRFNIYSGSNWYYYLGDGKLYLRDSNASHYLNITWNEDDTAARTLNLLVAGGNRSLTLNENFTIGDGSAGTITFGVASKTLTISEDVTLDGDITVGTAYLYDAGGENITGDGTDLTINSGGLINLTATSDVVIPVNIGLKLGDGDEKLETNNTDLTVNSGGDINLTATSDINVPANVGVTFGDGAEKLESNNTDLTINSGVDINLTATSDVNIPANVGVTYGDDGEKIEGDGTDLTISSSGVLNLTATNGVMLNNKMTLAENAGIYFDAALSADGKYSGWVRTGVAGATLAFGDLIYLAVADSRWELADASAEATTKPLLGICVLAAANDGDATTVFLIGFVRADTAFPALTVGAPAFVSETAGDIVVAAPTTSGACMRVVGQAYTADELWFNPSLDWFEHA